MNGQSCYDCYNRRRRNTLVASTHLATGSAAADAAEPSAAPHAEAGGFHLDDALVGERGAAVVYAFLAFLTLARAGRCGRRFSRAHDAGGRRRRGPGACPVREHWRRWDQCSRHHRR
jgi:hypothetical protein